MKTRILLPAAVLFTGLSLGWNSPPRDNPQINLSMDFISPTRITQGDNGYLFVTDYRLGSVTKIDPEEMEPRHVFFPEGNITGIAAKGPRIYVGNETLKRIEIYNKRGRLKGVLGGEDTVVGDPTDMVIDYERNLLYAVDGAEKHIKVFSLEGQNGYLIATISGPGEENYTFQHPTGIAIDPAAEEIFVADFGEPDDRLYPRIIIFGYDGVYKGMVDGKDGMMGYHFSKPQGIAVDGTGRIFVVDAWQGYVAVMDRSTADIITKIGEYGYDPQQLRLPLDMVIIGENKDIYVTNNMNKRIEVYPGGGQ